MRKKLSSTRSCYPSDLDWAASLPEELVCTVLDYLFEPIVFVRFATVCKLWRSFAKNYVRSAHRGLKLLPPMLMFPNSIGTTSWKLYSLSEGKFYDSINMSGFDNVEGRRYYGCGNGWLATVDDQLPGLPVLNLYNPFRKVVIPLNPIVCPLGQSFKPDIIPKLLLSGDPSLKGDNSFTVIALYNNDSALAFTRGGQRFWTILETKPYWSITDAVFYKDQVYTVDKNWGKIVSFDLNSSCSSGLLPKAKKHRTSITSTKCSSCRSYLVESTKGELLHVRRYFQQQRKSSQQARRVTNTFKVFKLVSDDEGAIVEQVELETIGDETLFVGDSQSMSVLASSFSMCKPNSIYYTSDSLTVPILNFVEKSDMGIFDLQQGTITPIQLPQDFMYSYMSQPGIWILPSVNELC